MGMFLLSWPFRRALVDPMAPMGIDHFNEDPAAEVWIHEGPLWPPDPQTAILVQGSGTPNNYSRIKPFPLFWGLQRSV